mgnify:CR=1 FL=1
MKRYTIGFMAAVVMMINFGSPVLAETNPKSGAKIVWMDDSNEVLLRDANGNPIQSELGFLLERGCTVQTGNSTVEMTLVPNGSVIVIDKNTLFRIDSLYGRDGTSDNNVFSLVRGKIRFIAARITGAFYSVQTPTAAAGVRGTDFYRMYDPQAGKDWLCVTEGAVQFDSPAGDKGVLVPAGFFVNLKNGFHTAEPDAEWLKTNLNLNTLHGAVPPAQS